MDRRRVRTRHTCTGGDTVAIDPNRISKERAVSLANRAQTREKRSRDEQKLVEEMLVRKASVAVAATTYGVLTRVGVSNTIGPVPWKIGVWLLTTGVEVFSNNRFLTAIAGGFSDATAAVYVDRALHHKDWVAGLGDGDESVAGLVSVAGGEI